MNSSHRQLVAIAGIVCLFAVGMAGLLNFYKFRSTATAIVKSRLAVVGRTVENSIQSALAIGLAFGELPALRATLDRELSADDVIRSIHVLDPTGQELYQVGGNGRAHDDRDAWLAAARAATGREWFVDSRSAPAVGVSIHNNFGVLVGYLVIPFSTDGINRAATQVARELAFTAFTIFIAAAGFAAMLVLGVIRRVARDVKRMEAALTGEGDAARTDGAGAAGRALGGFLSSVRTAENQIVAVRMKLHAGSNS